MAADRGRRVGGGPAARGRRARGRRATLLARAIHPAAPVHRDAFADGEQCCGGRRGVRDGRCRGERSGRARAGERRATGGVASSKQYARRGCSPARGVRSARALLPRRSVLRAPSCGGGRAGRARERKSGRTGVPHLAKQSRNRADPLARGCGACAGARDEIKRPVNLGPLSIPFYSIYFNLTNVPPRTNVWWRGRPSGWQLMMAVAKGLYGRIHSRPEKIFL